MRKILTTALFFAFSFTIAYAGVFDSTQQAVQINPATTSNTQAAVGINPISPVEEEGYKQAVSKIAESQTVLRQDIATYTVRYNDAKMRYDMAKTECKDLKKHIKNLNKRLKNSERARSLIEKNMPQEMI